MKLMWGYERLKEKKEYFLIWPWEEERLFFFCLCLTAGTWLGRLQHSPLTTWPLCFLWALTPSQYMCTFHSIFFKIRFENKPRREIEVFQVLADRLSPTKVFLHPHVIYQLVYKLHITRNSSYSLMQCLSYLALRLPRCRTARLQS